jgi:N-acetylmuramoyl-L-alanine amidase
MTSAPASPPVPVIRERPSPNHESRGEAPNIARTDMLVLHYTGMQSAAAAIDRLCDPEAKVSAHYVVEEDGAVWRLVDESRRGFHAGVSCWAGQPNLNLVSIGVEIVNPGHEWGYRAFPEAQMAVVEALCREILSRHPIPPHRVVGHSDIAPDRKSDPGELFDWARLARAGIGVWPEPAASLERLRGRGVGVLERTRALADLGRIGYCVSEADAGIVLAAFQRRFRPERWDGIFDAESCARLVEVRTAYDQARANWEARRRMH